MNIFDKFDLPNQTGERFTNAPLIKATGSLNKAAKKYHKKARGSNVMSVQVNSPDFKHLMKQLGKKSKGRPSSKPIEFAIYNDVSRPATPKEQGEGFDEIYYAKFWEYGWTSPAGNYIAGHRLFARTTNILKRIILEELKKSPSLFVRDDIYDAFDRACYRYINEVLIPESPRSQRKSKKRFKDSWNHKGSDDAN
jgi:hypothetical protein